MNRHLVRKLYPTLYKRSIHTSLNATDTSFAEAITEKFLKQVKKQRQPLEPEPTPFVEIAHLPRSTTREDINKLAREAFPNGHESIVEMVFRRDAEFGFIGRCVISMNSAEDAKRLVEYGHKRDMSGKVLQMYYIGDNKVDASKILSQYRRPEFQPVIGASSAAGRSVIISGFPWGMKTGFVQGYLREHNFFPVGRSTDNVLRLTTDVKDTSQFLVKFDSESEAWRCVRALHNMTDELRQQKTKFKLSVNVAY